MKNHYEEFFHNKMAPRKYWQDREVILAFNFSLIRILRDEMVHKDHHHRMEWYDLKFTLNCRLKEKTYMLPAFCMWVKGKL